MFTQQKVKTPPPSTTTPPPTPASDGTPVDPPRMTPQRPKQPPPPPPAKQKPQVPRKPQTKRVSFTPEPNESDQYDRLPTNDMRAIPQAALHEEMHAAAPTEPATVDTNDACAGVDSLLIRNRPPKAELKISKPVPRASLVLPDDLIIPPPPLFDTDVSDTLQEDLNMPPITVIPERIILPEPVEAETSMQSTTSTTPESEVPPPVNYNAYPQFVSQPIVDDRARSAIISEVPSQHVFRTQDYPSLSSEECYNELSYSPIGEPEPPELLQVQYKVLPIVSHVPNSPCNFHPDRSYYSDGPGPTPIHNSLKDLRIKNVSPGMIHSTTYPPLASFNPYPSLTTVAGTFNPYTCTVPISTNESSKSHKAHVSPSVVNTGKDINANVTEAVPLYTGDVPKSEQLERRVHFGEVTTAPDSDTLSDSSDIMGEGSSSSASTLKPAWSSKIKAFAIGEVIINVRHYPHTHSASFDCVRRQPKQNTDNNTHRSSLHTPCFFVIYLIYRY